jgi:hypothetical protein
VKGRIWILVFTMLFALLIGGYVTAFKLLHIDKRVTEYLVRRASRELNGIVDISSLTISPWNIGFHHVKVKFLDSPLTVEADAIRLGLSPIRFILNDFKFEYGAEELYIDHPVVTWSISGADTTKKGPLLEKIPEISLRNFPYLMMNVSDGVFVIERKGANLVVADHLGGIIDARSAGEAMMRLQADVFSPGKNASCTGRFERATNTIVMDVTARGCDLSRQPLGTLTDSLRIEAGILDIDLHVDQNKGNVTCQGSYSLGNAVVSMSGNKVRAEGISMKGRVNEHEILLDYATGKVNGTEPLVYGSLTFFPKSYLTVNLQVDGVDIREFARAYLPDADEYPHGIVSLKAETTGPLDDLSLRAECTAGQVTWRNTPVRDVRFSLLLRGRTLTVEHLSGSAAGLDISADGFIHDISPGTVGTYSFSATARNLSDRLPAYSLRIKGTADIDRKITTAEYDFLRERVPSDPLSHVTGALELDDRRLTFTCVTPAASMNGTIVDLTSNPQMEAMVHLMHFPLQSYAGLDSIGIVADGGGELTGSRESAAFNGTFTMRVGDTVSARISGKAICSDPFDPGRAITADAHITEFRALNALPLSMTVSLRSDSSATSLTADTESQTARLLLTADRSADSISGYLKLDRFPLEYIVGIFIKDSPGFSGRLSGEADISGTRAKPVFSSPLPIQAEDLTLAEIKNLSGSLKVSGGTDSIRFTDGVMKRFDTTVATCTGVWTEGNPFVLTAGGTNVELGTIGDLISPGRKCNGSVDYSLTMGFTLASGTVDGGFTVSDGHFLDIPFDRASAVIGGGSKGFTVTDFQVEKKGSFSGTGSATSGYFWHDDTQNQGQIGRASCRERV